ncbi:phosphotransferase [Poriferisphaera sp. WC338]|uniref:phosphotransferase n=1 Tax=Poriferisphaera sp. WC338 TaxID=3425129 RepID=UPI003D818241
MPLTGGRYTEGIVRVGNTVRRPASETSPFWSRVLRHCELQDCTVVPRYLDTDERGRDVLQFIPGWVPLKFQLFEDWQIAEAGRLLRVFHDATCGSDLAGECAVVCHHDPGPNNTVFQEEKPIAFIDFDFCKPGDPLEDMAYMAWTWCISSKPSRGPLAVQTHQVRVFADAYGLDVLQRQGLMDAVLKRQQKNIAFWLQQAEVLTCKPTDPGEIQARIQWSKCEFTFVQQNLAAFQTALVT